MMKQLSALLIFAVFALAQPLSPEIFSSLDREVAGLMDAWVHMREGRDNSSAGLFMAGTAILRAEAAFDAAVLCDKDLLPVEVAEFWTAYLKSSADCINIFRKAVGSLATSDEVEELLLASFARWVTTGEELLESVQSTR